MGVLYRMTFPNGKLYIGKTERSMEERILEHRKKVRRSNCILYRAWRKYGAPTLQVLAVIEDELLEETEVKAIAAYGSFGGGYNMTLGGEGTSGRSHSLESRSKISLAVRSHMTPQRRREISSAAKKRGIDPATLAKAIAANTGRRLSLEHCAKISAANKGQSLSADQQARLSAARWTPENVAKLAARNSARVYTPEMRARMSALSHKLWSIRRRSGTDRCTPEHRANISASLKGHVKTAEHMAAIKDGRMKRKLEALTPPHTEV